MDDCVLYAIFRRDIPVVKGNDIYFDVDVDKFKHLYFGITNDFKRRMKEHKKFSNVGGLGPKVYKSIKSHGWGVYDKLILFAGLSRQEAKDKEVEMISLYRTFERGLNSTPGGDGTAFQGSEHPMAQAVNVFNNTTREITSFLWIGDAANFLGILPSVAGAVANRNIPKQTQTFSPKFNTWFQIKHTDDTTPFVLNMKTKNQKITDNNKKRVVIIDLDTRVEVEFDGVITAASHFGISQYNIHTTISRQIKQFNVGNTRYDAQYVPKTREWDFNIVPTNKAKAIAQSKAVVAFDIHDNLVYSFNSAKDAADFIKIDNSTIGKSANHHSLLAGGLRWEFQDEQKRKEIEEKRPRSVITVP